MFARTVVTFTTLLFVSAGAALAQAPASGQASTPAATRNPITGDPGTKPVPPRKPNAKALARADKQAPGTENGNQPDRAAAGGGSR